jgi:hypothetical protein
MSVPRIFFVLPGLLAGVLIPTVLAAPHKAPAGAMGMVGDDYAHPVVTVHRGERLTLVNNSDVVHVVGPGRDTHIISPVSGVPMTGFHLMETNAVFTTGRWMALGTFYLTCSVHPGMDLKVVVIR